MELPIHPYVGVGPVGLGIGRAQVRDSIPARVLPFQKAGDPLECDAFHDVGLLVYYKAGYIVIAIECCEPSSPTLLGRALLGQPYGVVQEWLRRLDPDIETDASGLTSRKYGVGLYAPAGDSEPSEPIEAVIVFEHGYYDRG